MDLYDVAVARKLSSGGGGGGGSSDFSTAEVMLRNESPKSGMSIIIPIIAEDNIELIRGINTSFGAVFNVPLFKGECVGYSEDAGGFTYTGDITRNGTDIIITGNGTITFTP